VNRRKLQLVLVIGVVSLLSAVGVAVATGGRGDIREELTGYAETPLALSTPANGDFKLDIDRSRQELNYRLRYEGFTTPVLQAHIHFGSESQSGGISVFLCTNLGNGPAGTPACPTPSGTVTGTLRAADVIGPSGQGIAAGEFEELVAAIRAGYTYANVHSTERPAGEIRAQLDDRGRGRD
jgi:CHRD domain-containing protein